MKFVAVAFDLDGTLYPDFRLYIRLFPFFLKESRLLIAFGKARKYLHGTDSYDGNFYDVQARIMARFLGENADRIREKTEKLIYCGWERHFRKIALFPNVKETLDAFRDRGIKMGILSDFPPETKLEYLGLSGYWDAVVCSEVSGRLKPHPIPFKDLAGKMEIEAERILFVGNSVRYDVAGASRVGMKTALVKPFWKRRPSGPVPDFIFHDYRQLRDFVLG